MLRSIFGNTNSFTPNYYQCTKCGLVYDGPVLETRGKECRCGSTSFKLVSKPIRMQPELRSNHKLNSITHGGGNTFEENENPTAEEIQKTKHNLSKAWSVVIVFVVAAILIAIFSSLPATAPKAIPIEQPKVVVVEQVPVVVMETQASAPIVISSQDRVDVKSVSSFGPVQIMMFGLLLVIALCGYLDRRQSNQAYDAGIAIILAVVVVWFGSLLFVRAFFNAIGLVNPSLLIFFVSLAIVMTTALTGGVDFSPVGMFFGIIAIFGGVILSNLGSLQDVLKIPSSSLLTIPTVFQLIVAKQWEMATFSMVVYGCMTIAIVAYGYEILRPSKTRQTNVRGMLISLGGVGLFVGLRVFAQDVPVLGTIGGAFMIVVIYNFIIATIAREHLSGSGVNWAEYKLGLVKLVSPWDIFAFQAIVGALLTIAIGKL